MQQQKSENERLKALRDFKILDTPREPDLDQIVALAASICDAPIALISLIDRNRQWHKAAVGTDLNELSLEGSFCKHVIQGKQLVEVSDASKDERTLKNPMVTQKGIRFYAGVPLVTSRSHVLGTLCVLDVRAKQLAWDQRSTLELLAKQVMKHFELGLSRRQLLQQKSKLQATKIQLAETTQFLTRIMNNIPVALACKSLQTGGRYTLWNKQAAAIWGMSRERVLGKTDQNLFPVERNMRTAPKEANAIATGNVVETEEEVVDPQSRQRRLLQTRYIPIPHGGRRPKFMLVISEDVTEKRAAEMQLMQASRMSSLGKMASGVSHEINNPLAIIRGKVFQLESLLKKSAGPDQISPLVMKIDEMALRISKIVNGLQMFVRDGRHEAYRPMTVGELISASHEVCGTRFHSRGVRLDLPTENMDLQFECGNVQISQVMVNLLNNALDAAANSADKWVKVEFADKGDNVEFAVTDSGAGIPAATRHEIMRPFFTTKPIGQGTGLGLSISKGIVEAHGGELWLDNTPATRFVFKIPKRKTSKNLIEENQAVS